MTCRPPIGVPPCLAMLVAAGVCLASVTIFDVHAQGAYPRSFTDGKGHKVVQTAKPARIASIVLGVDENLVDLVEASRIVAMTGLAKLPDVSNVSNRLPAGIIFVKDRWQPIAEAKPDLVLAATYTPTFANPLIARKLPVYQFSEFNSVDALLKNFETLGKLVGEEQKAEAVLKADRLLLAEAAKKRWPKPIRAVYFSEGSLYAAGTVPAEIIKLAGLTDAASEFGLSMYVKATPTLIENLHPDVVLFGEDNQQAETETKALFGQAAYQQIAAIKAGHLYAIPGKHITTTSHQIVQAVADVQKLVVP